MGLLEKFIEQVNKENLFSSKDHLIIAVSGGVDSVVLCELCKQAGFHFSIAHCNFQLRGAESERDEKFVRDLAEKYKVKIEVKQFDTELYAKENKLSIQEAARALRYNWFKELVDCPLPTAHCPLLTAHHADDNVETVLMNFFRGTGLHGMTGIPPKGKDDMNFVRRPLLPFFKEELQQYAIKNKLEYVEDSSNRSSKYTRNNFRNEIIPAIEKQYPQVRQNLSDNISRFSEIEKLYRLSVDEIKKKLYRRKEEEVHIPVLQLMKYNNRSLYYEVISDFGFNEKQVDELIKLSISESGKYIHSDSHRIIKHRHWFVITPVQNELSENIIIEEGTKEISCPGGKIQLEITRNTKPETRNQSELFDLKHIRFPLLLRKAKTADYFYPLGMKKKKKKLARFFIDLKLSKAEKEKVWVLESDQRIVWVVGFRMDERFKLTDHTTDILMISLI